MKTDIFGSLVKSEEKENLLFIFHLFFPQILFLFVFALCVAMSFFRGTAQNWFHREDAAQTAALRHPRIFAQPDYPLAAWHSFESKCQGGVPPFF